MSKQEQVDALESVIRLAEARDMQWAIGGNVPPWLIAALEKRGWHIDPPVPYYRPPRPESHPAYWQKEGERMLYHMWRRLLCRLGGHAGQCKSGAFRCDYCAYTVWY